MQEVTMRFRAVWILVVALSIHAAAPCLQGQTGPNTPPTPLAEKHNRAPDGWFPFVPDRDDFSPALLDLRVLNEPEAGSQGRVVARGNNLVFEKTGKKIRFWGVCMVEEIMQMSKTDMDYLARRLAKMGVNLVRIGATPQPKRMEAVHYLVAALKKQGIYSHLVWFSTAGSDTILGTYFDDGAIAKYKEIARTVLGQVNPYTGLPLAKDPAVASVELIDEDSILWYSFKPYKTIGAEAWQRLERLFGDWLKARYGSLDKASAAWGPATYPKGDDFADRRVAFYSANELGSADWAVAQRNPKRATDQVEFLTGVERNWYAGMKSWLRDEQGYDGIVIGSNWMTADTRNLDPLDQYANMAGDATAWNCYFSGPCTTGTRLATNDFYADLSLLKNPFQSMLMHKQVSGLPHIMTEGDWPIPNRFRAEEPFLEAAYGSMQGMSGWCIFTLGSSEWITQYGKRWFVQVPVEMGQYPAASIIFRQGYVKEGPVVIDDALALKDLYALKGARFVPQAHGSVDFNAKSGAPGSGFGKADTTGDPTNAALSKADTLSYYVGRVVRTIGDDPGRSYILPNLDTYIDRPGKIVRSTTGELTLDYGKGVCTVNAPCAQGATGFLRDARTIALADISVDFQNEYGSVLVVSLDGKPLKASDKILVQVMTEEQPYGYKTESAKHTFSKEQGEIDCLKIVSVGEAPICVRKFDGTVTLKRADAGKLKISALDPNGRKVKDLPAGGGDALKVDLLPDCLYYVIHK